MTAPVRNSVVPKEPLYEVINPAGLMKRSESVPMTERLSTLEGKRVYCISQYIGGSDVFMRALSETLTRLYPGVETIYVDRQTAYMADEPELWQAVCDHADAFVYGCGACGSCSMWGAHWSIELEKRGKPGVFIVDNPFQADVTVTCEKDGLPALRRVIVPHPCGGLPQEQMEAITARVADELTRPLIDRERKPSGNIGGAHPRIAFRGTLADVGEFFHRRNWSDGLPFVPPTEAAVDRMMAATTSAADTVVSNAFPPESAEITAEKVAAVGVMAGCPPQAMPLLLAMTEAMSAPWFFSGVRSTTSFSYATLVNGPFATEIGMNAGANALGSGTANRINATIGRFNRLSLICLGGSQTGISDMSSIGNPSKYSFAFAENEARSPWEPFHQSQGFAPDESVATILGGGWSFLSPFARMMADIELGIQSMAQSIARFELPSGALLLMDPLVASSLAAAGYSKVEVERKLRHLAVRSAREFRDDYFYKPFIEPTLRGKSAYSDSHSWDPSLLSAPDDETVQVFPADSVRIVVVGGETNPMTQAWQLARPSSISIDKWR